MTEELHETKNKLRKEVLQHRNSISESHKRILSEKIHAFLLSDPVWQSAQTVMLYSACRSEVVLDRVIEHALKHKNIVLIPCILDDQKHMIPVRVASLSDISDRGRYGMLQPKRELCEPYKGLIDLVVVPGVVFDHYGARIGYGKGYYDMFLKQYPQRMRIGIAFACQLREKIVQTIHDVAMHKIITEHSVVNVKT